MAETSGENFHWKYSDEYVIDSLSQKLKEEADKYYPDVTPSRAIVKGKPWGGQETARTFRFEIRSADRSNSHFVFIKLCPIFPSMNPALLEYETLQLLYDRMPHVQEGCYVSRPLAYYSEFNAYAMESVGTKSFKPYLLKNNSRFRSDSSLSGLFSIVSGCARWLKAFHEITRSRQSMLFQHKTIIDNINEDFDFKSLRKFHFKKDTIHQLDRLIDKLASVDNKYEIPCAKWHWDFTPGHVYLDNNRISVIDILGINDTPIYEDIGRFLASMTCINTFPFFPFYDYRRAEGPLCDRFIESYAANTGYDKEQFLFFTRVYLLQYLIVWFFQQHLRVSSKINAAAADAFANFRLVKFYEIPLLHTINKIQESL